MFVVQFFDVLPPVNVFLSYCSENGGIILTIMLNYCESRVHFVHNRIFIHYYIPIIRQIEHISDIPQSDDI